MIKPIVNAEETVKGIKILVGQRPYYRYKDEEGKRVKTGIIEGYSYECVALEKQFERFNVKIEGTEPLYKDVKKIPQNCQVEVENLSAVAYIAGDAYKYVACSFKAESILEVDDE